MTTSSSKIKPFSTSEDQLKFNQCLHEIQQMFEMRFIEKICSPKSKSQRQKLFEDFNIKFQKLHQMMDQITKYYTNKNLKRKDKKQTKDDQIALERIKQLTHKVESAYKQLFVNGSFKYYVKAAVLLGLPIRLHTINVQQWCYQVLTGIIARDSWCC